MRIYLKLLMVSILSFPLLSSASDPEVFMSFDFGNGQVENGFDNWMYSDKGENPCGVYAGDRQSKLCGPDGLRFYPYYNYYNTAHMGWTRFGFIDSEQDIAVKGHSLKIKMTGGAYRDFSDNLIFLGPVVKSKADYDGVTEQESNTETPSTLDGAIALYLKTNSSTAKFELFEDKNRLTVWLFMPPEAGSFDQQKRTTAKRRPDISFSMYPFINDSRGGHYYHYISNVPMGGWTKVQFDAHPLHYNGGSPGPYSAFEEGGYEYSGNGAEYFKNTVALAFVPSFSSGLPIMSEYYLDELKLSNKAFENEETISGLAVGYSPSNNLFDISFNDKYRCLVCASTYQVRYSFQPINNSNFEQAYLPRQVINFNRDKNNSDGLVHKPNSGYNQIWAGLEIQDQHKERLTDHTKIYFAVKDMSTRDEITQHPVDFELVNVPGVGNVRKMDLIKSIEYEIIPVPDIIDSDPTQTLPDDIPAYGDIPQCTLLVDFKYSESDSVIADARFDSIDTDKYTKFNDVGTTISIGSNKSYDYQMVSGSGFTLQAGDKIRLIWKNASDDLINFAPKVSFVSRGRVSSSNLSSWTTASALNLEPDSSGVSELIVGEKITGTFINVNVNYSNNKALILDRIELVERATSATQTCENIEGVALPQTLLAVDFNSSSTESLRPLAELDTIIKGIFTNVVGSGIGSVRWGHPDLNYQGVTGTGKELKVGDTIRMTWLNTSETDITFSPRLTFTQTGRYTGDSADEWFELEPVSIPANGTSLSEFVITEYNAGLIQVINVGNNTSIMNTLLLDKIELVIVPD